MREIKFRAWDRESKVIVNGLALNFSGKIMVTKKRGPDGKYVFKQQDGYDRDRFELQQFTGLHDKNGKEIYENDYLGDWWVVWGSGKYILQNISTGDIIDCTNNTIYDKEITGNSHEHPREHKAMASEL